MSMETRSTKRRRIYKRKFDHELAIDMAEKGFSASEIRRHLGNVVSVSAISRVIDPKLRAKMDKRSRAYLMSGTCLKCGGPRRKYRSRKQQGEDSGLCKRCWGTAKQTRFLLNEDDSVSHVRCSSCKNWFPAEIFPRNRTSSRGFHTNCKSCGTKRRAEWRERQKIPCIICGKPALPPREKGRRAAAIARCRDCYLDLKSGRREPLDDEPEVM